MTREQWAKMSDEERRVKVAELCGWTFIGYTGNVGYAHRRLLGVHPSHGDTPAYRVGSCPIPDSLNDLNAMHEAEKLLKHKAREFDRILWHVVMRSPIDEGWIIDAPHIHATAAQRAEAFALTMEPV